MVCLVNPVGVVAKYNRQGGKSNTDIWVATVFFNFVGVREV